jgi:hypothetical protein
LLVNRSSKDDDNCLDLAQLKRYISEHLNDYWIMHDIHYTVMLLHPNLKSFQVIPDKKEHAVSLIELQLAELIDPLIIQPMLSTITNNKNKTQLKKKIHSTNTSDEIFDTPISDNNIQQQPNDKTELDRYLEDETRIDNSRNILTYWNSNKFLYSHLARIAKRILAIPATNTSIERLFSDSGNIITDR